MTDSSLRPRLLIAGYSTRAAAWSAVRAGFRPVCVDRFLDLDLRQVADVLEHASINDASSWRACLSPVSARLSLLDLHESEDLSEAERQDLCQSLGPELTFATEGRRLLRDPYWMSEILSRHGIPALAVTSPQACVSSDRAWLVKPLQGGGGHRIRRWSRELAHELNPEDYYLQEFRAGVPMSAICLGSSQGVEIVGTTRQLIHHPASSPPEPFSYCGNLAPLPDHAERDQSVRRIAELLTDSARIRGLFGIDFIWDGERPWVVEINPRYTAACELLELTLGRPLLTDHWRKILGEDTDLAIPTSPSHHKSFCIAGKIIVYADRDLEAPDLSRFVRDRSPWSFPYLADVPRPQTRFRAGEPLCTVYATGPDPEAVHGKLIRRAQWVKRMFTQ